MGQKFERKFLSIYYNRSTDCQVYLGELAFIESS
jgi:hypothetical protein